MEDDFLFDGLRVIEAATWIAAPVSGTMLADMGADVIKVESPDGGDAYRNFALNPATPKADDGVNYTWALDARNKRSMTLNLKSEEGMSIMRKLVESCDVYITNHPLAMRRECGLTYEDLAPLNPRMIYASFTAYGEEGPERDREGFDLVAYWARSGLMDLVRSHGAEPAQSLPGMGDHPSGVAVYANIVTALLRRERSGKGGLVHTSLLANGLWSISCIAQAVFGGSDLAGYRSPERAHFNRALYEAADGRWMQFTMLQTAEQFDRFLVALEATDLLSDSRYATVESRFENALELTAYLRGVLAQRTAAEWMVRFAEFDVPASLVGRAVDLPNDPQVAANDMVVAPVEDVGMDRVIRDPLNVEGVPRVGVKKAPDHGQHTADVLAELGLSDAEVADLRGRGIV